MSGHVPSVVASARSAPPRDFDGIFKALLDAHPRDALQLLCGATLRDGDVITPEPTEQPRQRNRQCDKVVTIRHEDGTPTDVYQVGGSLATQLVEALRRRGMNNILEQTETGREIARKSREEGREAGHVDLMRAALRAAYGDIADLDELAGRLADRDHSGNIGRIVAGATLDDLRA